MSIPKARVERLYMMVYETRHNPRQQNKHIAEIKRIMDCYPKLFK